MCPAIFLSAALLCLVTCGYAVKAASDLQNPITSDVNSPAMANDNRIQSDANTKQRRLFSTWDKKHSEPEADPQAAAMDSVAEDAQFDNIGAPARESTYVPYSDDSIDSSDLSDSSDFSDSSDTVGVASKSGRIPHWRLYVYALKYRRYFKWDHRTRAQVLQDLAINEEYHDGWTRHNTYLDKGYLVYLDKQCARPKNINEPACA
ncbi:unnamed protein product [Hyaloperonospora brassicae]|uniref:RxLR effector protein n=1 Tax=Hyaloperonospora brassicae TaxID=162125 RepID=A0AAV0UK75_HYABA|nr:unnamed protein product [Hyaloperonospora brassicae]